MNASTTTSNRTAYSCIRCSDRKVKCDRQDPCGACRKHNVQCVFRPIRQSLRKQKRLKKGALIDRLQHYEAFLEERGFDPRTVAHPEASHRDESLQVEPSFQLQTPSSLTSEQNAVLEQEQMIPERGRVKFVDNSLITHVAEEVTDEDSLESLHEESHGEGSEDNFDLLIGASSRHYRRCSHPPTDQIFALWQIFADNVDPLTKVVHAPSITLKLEKATKDIDGVPKSFNALMFAIYTTAIASLSDLECQTRFDQSRTKLLKRYSAATKVALAKADFTTSNNIVVLQALVLHILSIRDICHPRSMWILTSVAIRIAEGMGLNRDAKSLGFSPFDTEIRRRIWFYLNMHNNNAAEMCGQQKFPGLDMDVNLDTALANVNDNEVRSGMSDSPTGSSIPTDMVFCAVQSEFFVFARQMTIMNRRHIGLNSLIDDFASKESIMPNDDVLQKLEDDVEAKYLRHCDPSDPLQLMTIVFARYCVNVSHFMAHHPRKWQTREHMPNSEQKYVWDVSIKLFEQLDMMQSSSHLQRFAWNSAYYMQWWALIHIMDSLRAEPLMPDSNKAWRLLEKTFENNPAIVTDTRRPLYVAVGNLCLKAFSARETAMAKAKNPISQVPDFIQKLRQERNTAKKRAQAKHILQTERGGHPYKTNANRSANDASTYTRADHQEVLASEANNSANWPAENSNTTGFGATDDLFDQNTSLMLIEDQDMDNAEVQAIDWTQWDAWLSGTDFQNVETPWTLNAT